MRTMGAAAAVAAAWMALVAPAHAARGGSDVVHGAGLSADIGQQARQSHFTDTGHVGDVAAWPAEGDSLYLKDFRLRAVGPHVEVWTPVGDDVSSGLDFPAGDCRDGLKTTVTDAQIGYLVDQFEQVIRPREAAVFGVPKNRDGKDATLPGFVPAIPKNAYRGPGDRLVILVDNFRDANFFTPQTGAKTTGMVDPTQMRATDRNIVNLSGLQWAYRLGADPRAEAPTGDPCTAATSVHNGVEATLAHEYNHVLQGSQGDDYTELEHEPSWFLEGMAQWAAQLAGYVDPTVHDDRNGFVDCFLGWSGLHAPDYLRQCLGGPENSLTIFGEVGQSSTAEYGSVATFFTMLAQRYGTGFVGELIHNTPGVWCSERISRLLAERGLPERFNDLLGAWAASVAPSVELDNPSAYQRPGVPPNGSDFVRLRDSTGAAFAADDLSSLTFDGQPRVACKWTIDPDGHGPGDAALYSGTGENGQNKVIAAAVVVDAGNAALDFDAKYDLEPGWDFGSVQVSTDGGETWQSVDATTTTSDHEPFAAPPIVADLPGFTGDSGGWVHEHADLSRWSGQHVLVGFRYHTDPGVTHAGMWIDNVTVGGHLVSDGSTFAGLQQLPPRVTTVELQLVSYTADHQVARIARVPLDANYDAHLDASAVHQLVAPGARSVAAIVTYVQHDELLFCRVDYALTINGFLQPGG